MTRRVAKPNAARKRGQAATQATTGWPTPEPFDLALMEHYGRAPDWPRYRRLVELGAEAGDPLACYAVATWYLHGEPYLGIRPHPTRWVDWLRRAARSLNRAMYDLAVSKMAGYGMTTDRRGAYRLFARAAGLGCICAMAAQAKCLMEGTGVVADKPRGQRLARHAQRLTARLARIPA